MKARYYPSKGFSEADFRRDPKYTAVMDKNHVIYRDAPPNDPVTDPKNKWLHLLRACDPIQLPNLKYRE